MLREPLIDLLGYSALGRFSALDHAAAMKKLTYGREIGLCHDSVVAPYPSPRKCGLCPAACRGNVEGPTGTPTTGLTRSGCGFLPALHAITVGRGVGMPEPSTALGLRAVPLRTDVSVTWSHRSPRSQGGTRASLHPTDSRGELPPKPARCGR